jgi:hypothetical protein
MVDTGVLRESHALMRYRQRYRVTDLLLFPAHIVSESLDELAELTSRLFSPVQNRGREPLPMIEDHPFGPDQKGVRTCPNAMELL